MAELILPSRRVPFGGVLVIHSWWGRTDSFSEYGQALANAGFVAGLSDLFDGRTAATAAQARALRRRPRRIPMYHTLRDDLAEVRASLPATGKLAVVGFSMGGHWAVWLSQQADLPIASVVLYYAARGGDFRASRAAYLAHFAEQDPWLSSAARRNMERRLQVADRPYTSFDYAGTGHWFAESARPEAFVRGAAATARRRTVAHLKKTLTG
ncbi:MAG: dienelactone hydrolase family protein [Alphaproteobacteria bacterium]